MRIKEQDVEAGKVHTGRVLAANGRPAQRDEGQRQGESLGRSLQEYGRGLAGGLLFSLPLLYTAEVWKLGASLSPERLGVGLLGTFVLLLGYNRYAGLRQDASFIEVVIDSVEELGLGIVVAAALLWLLGQIGPGQPASTISTMVLTEGMLVAIGVSVGTAQLGGDEDSGVAGDEAAGQAKEQPGRLLERDIVLGVCGAVLVAANIAPTHEVVDLAAEMGPWRLIGLVLLSLVLGAIILFYSQFVGSGSAKDRPAPWRIVAEALLIYATALLSAAGLLWFFGRFEGAGLPMLLAMTVVLGAASILGASAGRLLLQP